MEGHGQKPSALRASASYHKQYRYPSFAGSPGKWDVKGFLSREKASLFTSIDAWSGDGGHRNGISPKFDAPAGRCSKAAKVTQESDRGPAAGGPERAGRLIPFGNIPFSPSHVCSVSHLRPKAGGEWMCFRFFPIFLMAARWWPEAASAVHWGTAGRRARRPACRPCRRWPMRGGATACRRTGRPAAATRVKRSSTAWA